MTAFRCGHATLVGRPNAGKSTLLNQILEARLAITSPRPQTTRDRITGIHNDDTMQLILLDTPGLHEAWTALNQAMVQRARETLSEVDVVVWVEDAARMARRVRENKPAFDDFATELAAELSQGKAPVLVVLNKIDLVAPPALLPLMEAVHAQLPDAAAPLPVSASTGDGVAELMAQIRARLPEGPALHPQDEWTPVTERFLVAELIREQVFAHTRQELPYATAVEIESFDESERDAGMVRIRAAIIVEKGSQKGIVIGKGGQMIKKLGTEARLQIEALLDSRVHLELFVKVEPDWTRTERGLKRVGFDGTGR